MCEVKAQPGIRQFGEAAVEVVCGLAPALSRVHVLKGQPPSEWAVEDRIGDRVRVDDDGVDPRRDLAKLLREPPLVIAAGPSTGRER